MALTLNGRLEPTGSDVASLAQCRVEIFFERKPPIEAPAVPESPAVGTPRRDPRLRLGKNAASAQSAFAETVQGRASTYTDRLGKFEVSVPDDIALTAKLRFVVSAPSGQMLADIEHKLESSKELVKISVKSKDLGRIAVEPQTDPTPTATRRITGLVIDRNGKRLPPNLQVLLFAQKRVDRSPKTNGKNGEGSPILVARADSSGQFAGETRYEIYERALAIVSGIKDEIPVSLEDGFFPQPLLIVVDFPEPAVEPRTTDDCGCDGSEATPRTPSHADIENAPDTYSVDLGTGRCVQFNTPNRAIEEFNFYSVVRTTEPFIRGLTVGNVPVSDVPAPTAPEQPVDPRVFAETYKLDLQTGTRGTWGGVRVTLVTDDGGRHVIYSKDPVGSLLPNFNDPEIAARRFVENTTTTANIPVSGATSFDLRNLRSIDVEWSESNPGDGWAFKGIEISAKSTQGENISVLINNMELYTLAPQISLFSPAGRPQTWIASARIADRTVPPLATGRGNRGLGLYERLAPLGPVPARTPMRPLSRADLDDQNPIDWDSTPTFHEATTVAHGHLLHFKQVWYADGYSLGDLLYSLPLAPGQKKLVSVVDWERRERTERAESTFGSEDLNAALSHDRDLGEVVTGALTESSRGGSRNTTSGVGAGTGAAGNGSYQQFNFGGLVGVSGGYGESDSNAWQDSARNLSTTSLQNLRDNTLQSASAVRGLRSSVVQTVGQGEAVTATTEVVANHNHCHALTIQYFEVLRHLKLVHKLTDVQECLFVPLPLSEFDLPKLLRWAQPLRTYLQRAELAGGFDAARRVQTEWTEVDYPQLRYADESIKSLSGELLITVTIPLPPFPERPKPRPEDTALDTAKAVSDSINPTSGPIGILLGIVSLGATVAVSAATDAAISATKAAAAGARAVADELFAQPTAQERYDMFHHDVLPGVVEAFINQLEVYALVNGKEVTLPDIDFTLVSDYQPGKPLLVSLRGTVRGDVRRGDVSQLTINSPVGLPGGCRAIVNSATIRYRTRMFEHVFVEDARVNDDIDLPKVIPVFTTPYDMVVQKTSEGRGAALYTPVDEWEQRSPRVEDRRLSAQLVDHLNDNLEFYHHAIWWTMDPNRRYMLLDGYYAPGSTGRSIASVVENRLIGIVGNSLVLPVARGVHLDPRFVPGMDLLDLYKLDSPVPSTRISLPTRGVFAEAVMGSCNACEQIDDTRFWRWEDSPIDEPPLIDAASTSSRRTEPADVRPTAFPAPLVSIQNAAATPDPAGVRAALDTLTKQSFPDITGLAGTQANAAAAYQQALDTAFKFGKEASTLAQQAAMLNVKDKALGAIDNAEASGKIDPADAKNLRMSALKKMVGDGSNAGTSASTAAEQMKFIQDAVKDSSISPEDGRQFTKTVLDSYTGGTDEDQRDRAATANLKERMSADRVTKVQTTPDGTLVEQASFSDQALAERIVESGLRHFSSPELVISADEALVIFKFFWPDSDVASAGALSEEDRGFAQALLIEAADSSHSFGIVETIYRTFFGKVATDFEAVKEMIKEIAKKAIEEKWFERIKTLAEAEEQPIYEYVRVTEANKHRSVWLDRLQNGEVHY